jgi:hypothetical protein
MEEILKAAKSDKVDHRVEAFILTMRHSGMRIFDVAMLSVDSLKGNCLKVYQAKTGEPVWIVPDAVLYGFGRGCSVVSGRCRERMSQHS